MRPIDYIISFILGFGSSMIGGEIGFSPIERFIVAVLLGACYGVYRAYIVLNKE